MSSNASNSSRPGKRKKKGSSQQDKSSETLPSPAKSVSPPPSGRSSPDPVCSICLGRHESKCFTNNCLHEFCFKCLLEWSKIKAECPLCKQPFNSIIHNVRSNHEYDEHKIPVAEPEMPDFPDLLGSIHHRFRYRTTLTQERRAVLALERLHFLRQYRDAGVLPRSTTARQPRRSRLTGTSNFRRQTYQRDLWVRPLTDFTGRYRETTPEFFQLNPAMTHRLVPWLNRELNVLLTSHETRLAYVLEMILGMLKQHHIRSRPFREALRQYMGGNTEHFVHEFYQFARSPYDMYGFDENAEYQPRNNLQHEEVAVSESSEDEAAPTLAPNDIPLPPSPQPGPSGLNRVTATLSDDGQSYSVRLPARSSPSDDEDEDVEIVQVVRPSLPEVITLSDSDGSDHEQDAIASTSRGKALKRPPKDDRSHKDTKRSKSSKKKKASKRERSPSPLPPVREEDDGMTLRRPIRQVRYWEMNPEDLLQLHQRQTDSSSSSGASTSKSKIRPGTSSKQLINKKSSGNNKR